MTLRITITNEPAEPGHPVNVNVWHEVRGEAQNIAAECVELAPGESATVALWGKRGVTVVEQAASE